MNKNFTDFRINHFLRNLFFILFVKPLMMIILGLNIRNYEKLPKKGPAIIVANHNSHLDTLALMSIFPSSILKLIRPIAASDYFLSNKFLAWFSLCIIGIIPIERDIKFSKDPFNEVLEKLDQGCIVLIYPEGSRGEPEKLDNFKSGISHLAKKRPQVPIIPIFLHGFGKALPKGEAILIPFFCDIFVGDIINYTGDKTSFMKTLENSIISLAEKGNFSAWV